MLTQWVAHTCAAMVVWQDHGRACWMCWSLRDRFSHNVEQQVQGAAPIASAGPWDENPPCTLKHSETLPAIDFIVLTGLADIPHCSLLGFLPCSPGSIPWQCSQSWQ